MYDDTMSDLTTTKVTPAMPLVMRLQFSIIIKVILYCLANLKILYYERFSRIHILGDTKSDCLLNRYL